VGSQTMPPPLLMLPRAVDVEHVVVGDARLLPL
jgi:hypothetical protein